MYVPVSGLSFPPTDRPSDVATPRRSPRRSRGITLIEMLISVTLTLLIMFAVVRVFELMGSGLREGRATIEMAGQLRSVAHRLQQDLVKLPEPRKRLFH